MTAIPNRNTTRQQEVRLKIPADALVLVADGRKALVLSNRGDSAYPDLRLETASESAPNPPSREQGRERPGRVHSSVGDARSAVETADPHDRSEAEFAKETAAGFERLARDRAGSKIIVVAPPRTLAELRPALAAISDRIVAEIAKDLTNRPVHEIEAALTAE
jgi:protein required for attachment to host cells